MSNLCVIPARGGSKRIPRKNIRNFLGQPIISYAIQAALDCGLFDTVMVSTDDTEIGDIALSYGAKVPFIRSFKNSNDFATTFDVLQEVLQEYTNLEKTFDNLCCIYPTAPFATKERIVQAYDQLTKGNFDNVITITSFGFPIQRAFKVEDQKLSYFHPEYEKSRSQDLPKAYHDAGQLYWSKVQPLLANRSLVSKNTGFVELPETEVQDIDNEVDWQLAELKYSILKSRR